MWFKRAATVTKFMPAKKDKGAFAIAKLKRGDGKVYIGPAILEAGKVSELSVGQTVKLKHVPSKTHTGTLQATVISA